jgi:predicted metal-binding protein
MEANLVSTECAPTQNKYELGELDLCNDVIIDITGTICFDDRAREWCKLPYPGHPNGCPNWNKSVNCPPLVANAQENFDFGNKHWFVVIEFNLASHRAKMAKKHPNWSFRQCNCCLYWQNKVRCKLKKKCNDFLSRMPGYSYTLLPEAMGINIFKTVRKHGINIKKNPVDIVYKIALVAKRKESMTNIITTINIQQELFCSYVK